MTLLARHVGSQTWIVLSQSAECEYFPDAVESLWEKGLVVAGKVIGMLLLDFWRGSTNKCCRR